MGKADDPFYNRKPVPDELIKDIGYTGLTPQEEHANREKKYTLQGDDLRRFSHSSTGGFKPIADPYYGRKAVKDPEIAGVGETGLSPEEEFANRERKYSVNGVDVRRFGSTSSGGWHPQDDPYYARKAVKKPEIVGVGDTGNTPGQDYEIRERKQSVAQLSSDPFAILTGSGHRQSVSDIGGANAIREQQRRRSSAVAPDAVPSAAQHHSGYVGDRLAPIESKPELPPVNKLGATSSGTTANSSTLAGSHAGAANDTITAEGHTQFYDAATTGHNHLHQHNDLHDPDSVGPHDVR